MLFNVAMCTSPCTHSNLSCYMTHEIKFQKVISIYFCDWCDILLSIHVNNKFTYPYLKSNYTTDGNIKLHSECQIFSSMYPLNFTIPNLVCYNLQSFKMPIYWYGIKNTAKGVEKQTSLFVCSKWGYIYLGKCHSVFHLMVRHGTPVGLSFYNLYKTNLAR